MNSHFLEGFTDELVKTGGLPVVGKIRAGATMLGQKVRSIASSVAKRARGIQAETRGGNGLKGVATIKSMKAPGMPKKAAFVIKLADEADGDGDGGKGDDANDAGDILKSIIEEAEARLNNPGNEQGYNEQQSDGANDPSYGAGQGMDSPGPSGAGGGAGVGGGARNPSPNPSLPRPPRQPPPRTYVPKGQEPAKPSVPTPPPPKKPPSLKDIDLD